MSTIYYLNLTNGLERLDRGPADQHQWRFLRLQSTWCEQKLWEDIIWSSVSDDLLFNLAVGNLCIVVDYGARKQEPRAVWQGLEWVKFVLHMRWYGVRYEPTGRCETAGKYFYDQYCRMGPRTAAKLDYFKPFLYGYDVIRLAALRESTMHDGDKDYYANLVKETLE